VNLAAKLKRFRAWFAIPLAPAATLLYLCGSNVRFTEECVTIDVAPSSVHVAGEYAFKNPWPVPAYLGVAYPFPVDREHLTPENVRATLDGRPIRMLYLARASHALIGFRPRQIVRFRVEYDQQTTEHDATYILASTQRWKRPLEKAVFRLHPKGVTMKASTYRIEPCGQDEAGFERRNFMPSQDWRFWWEVP
jgi:hypothetical protein